MRPAQLDRFLGRLAGEQAVEETGGEPISPTDAIEDTRMDFGNTDMDGPWTERT